MLRRQKAFTAEYTESAEKIIKNLCALSVLSQRAIGTMRDKSTYLGLRVFNTLAGIFLALSLVGCEIPRAISSPIAIPQTATLAPTPSPTTSTNCAAGSHVDQLVSGGMTRQYRLYVPRSYQPDKPAALVFGFHGNTGHADQFESYSGFPPLADHAGFIVVYPQGAGEPPTWDVWQGSRDVQFVRDLIDRLETICNIDPARIYATGHSLGGGLANRLACDLAGRLAAIGLVSGAYVNAEPCAPARPVAVVSIHGTADSVIFYNGFGVNGSSPQAYFTVGTPIPQWASAWAQRNGCNAKSSIIFKKDPVTGQQWGNCRAGADVILYTIRDGEHGWPLPTTEFDAAQVIWDFFAKHPLVP